MYIQECEVVHCYTEKHWSANLQHNFLCILFIAIQVIHIFYPHFLQVTAAEEANNITIDFISLLFRHVCSRSHAEEAGKVQDVTFM